MLITGSVIRQHPNAGGYVGNQLIEQVAVGIIPRIIWREKPVGASEIYSISVLYTGAATESTFSEIGLIADSYRAAGLPSVFVFFLLLGGFMAYFYKKGRINNRDDVLIFYIILLSLITYNRSVVDVMLFLFQRAIFMWIFIRYILFENPVNNDKVDMNRL